MNKTEYLNAISTENKVLFAVLDKILLEKDSAIESSFGSIMNVDKALVYKQEGVFKYGLVCNKNYYSFHSMVMYAYPELKEILKSQGKKLKLQKGCINFSSAADFPLALFEAFIIQSAKKDFSVVLQYYKRKK